MPVNSKFGTNRRICTLEAHYCLRIATSLDLVTTLRKNSMPGLRFVDGKGTGGRRFRVQGPKNLVEKTDLYHKHR